MRRVRFVSQRVDDQQVEAAQFFQRFIGNQVAIGDERGLRPRVAEAEASDFAFTVNDRDRRNSQPAGFKLSFDHLWNELWQTPTDVFTIENVREDAPQPAAYGRTRVNWNRAATEIDRTDVIEAEDVVGMAVRDQQRVEPVNLLTQRLLAEIG